MTRILDGRALAFRLNKALKADTSTLARPPGLAVVLVGSDPASRVYVTRKGVVAGRIGFHNQLLEFDEAVDEATLFDAIDRLNQDDRIDGILVQLPLPKHLSSSRILDRVAPEKDVDGLTTGSAGLLAQGRPNLVACTPRGVMLLLEDAGILLAGKRAAVIGRSNIVGRPVAMLLEQAHCTVTVCHSRTCDVESIVRASDIVVVAVGIPNYVRGDWLAPDAVVIDVGINRLDDGSLCGDVAFDEALGRVSAITPVPGGVGPMTIAMLMRNTYVASVARQG